MPVKKGWKLDLLYRGNRISISLRRALQRGMVAMLMVVKPEGLTGGGREERDRELNRERGIEIYTQVRTFIIPIL